jgi:pimeloyl-ACP methyl ester carboxylesterase
MTARITAPTLMLWGQRSGFLDDELIARMGKAIGSFEVARTDTGHYIPREAPEEFTKLVQEFLDR